MPRNARIVVPDHPHHVVQRGNRRQKVFFSDRDKVAYLNFLRLYAKPAGIEILAYCLMDNHIHLIAVPKKEDSLAIGLKEAHVRYTRMINFREGWRGYLWEGRFKSHPLSESHLYSAIRYVERNPVRAKIVSKADDYNWSSAKAHVSKEKNVLLDDNYFLPEIEDWSLFLADGDNETDKALLKQHARTGRPLGDNNYIETLEKLTGRELKKKKPGPKRKN